MSDSQRKQPRTLAAQLGFQDPDLKTPQHDNAVVWLDARLHEEPFLRALRQTEPDLPAPELKECVWEYAVGDSRWTAGFVDLYAEIDSHIRGTRPSGEATSWSKPDEYFFEVKTTIPSLGELVRQIRFYEAKRPGKYSHSKWSKQTFYVVSSDQRWAESLRGQGIGFIAPHRPEARSVDGEQWAIAHPGSPAGTWERKDAA